jgi:hypothetical protein
MRPDVFYPLICAQCGKTSAVKFDRSDLATKLDNREPVFLVCEYDKFSTPASASQRVEMAKLLAATARSQ